jgi:hypothetical protein
MHDFEVGNRFTVTGPRAPFEGYTGVVTEIEDLSPYPIVTQVKNGDTVYDASFRSDEITKLVETVPVAEVPEMGT